MLEEAVAPGGEKSAVFRRLRISVLLSVLVVVAGLTWSVHDTILIASLVFAGSLAWSIRSLRVGFLAICMVGAGLWWSRRHEKRCSAWWLGRVAYQKLSGRIPFLGWKLLWRQVFFPCYEGTRPEFGNANVARLEEKTVGGRKWELYETKLGNFWVPAPGRWVLEFLTWEMTVQADYESGEVAIRPEDIVIDCGAHVGVFTRYALLRGAKRVIAIEPEPTNLACLESNFIKEIAKGQVIIIKAGVWNQRTFLSLFLSPVEENSGMHSFVRKWSPNPKVYKTLVLPLDEIVEQLKLDRVDFIKMDIEGAEREALQGASQTLRRFRPRMAICVYHLEDDPWVIPSVVKPAQSLYEIHAKDAEIIGPRVTPKVLFFR